MDKLFDRDVSVEMSTEIIAKKVWHRGSRLRARDMFDLALVAEKEPSALVEIRPVLRDRKESVLARIAQGEQQLRSDFAELEVLDYLRTLGTVPRINRGLSLIISSCRRFRGSRG